MIGPDPVGPTNVEVELAGYGGKYVLGRPEKTSEDDAEE